MGGSWSLVPVSGHLGQLFGYCVKEDCWTKTTDLIEEGSYVPMFRNQGTMPKKSHYNYLKLFVKLHQGIQVRLLL